MTRRTRVHKQLKKIKREKEKTDDRTAWIVDQEADIRNVDVREISVIEGAIHDWYQVAGGQIGGDYWFNENADESTLANFDEAEARIEDTSSSMHVRSSS